jgi:hypothetical protein
LASWYEKAGVRGGVRRLLRAEQEQGKVFFPAGLVPHLGHEEVRELPPGRARDLTIRHLYQFLLSTTHLETRIVNRAAELIATGQSGLDLPARVRLDAFKVYCDEGYHALYSLDLADQVATVTGIPIPPCDYGGVVGQVIDIGRRLLPGEPRLAALLQVVVFETLITAVLNEVPNDSSVVSTIREITRDHARDEGRHHRFFGAFLHELWTQLESSLRAPVALAMPALISGCLDWDVGPVRSSLRLAGLDEAAVERVLHDCYLGAEARDWKRQVASATVRLCESAGLLAIAGAEEEFAAHGLLDPRSSTTGRSAIEGLWSDR